VNLASIPFESNTNDREPLAPTGEEAALLTAIREAERSLAAAESAALCHRYSVGGEALQARVTAARGDVLAARQAWRAYDRQREAA